MALTFRDLKRMAANIKLTQPEPFMSSYCSDIKFEGYDSPPTFLTDPVEIAGYGMGPAKMGWKGEPLGTTDKLQVPVIPTDIMCEALEEVTVNVAREVQQNLLKVSGAQIRAARSLLSSCLHLTFTSLLAVEIPCLHQRQGKGQEPHYATCRSQIQAHCKHEGAPCFNHDSGRQAE